MLPNCGQRRVINQYIKKLKNLKEYTEDQLLELIHDIIKIDGIDKAADFIFLIALKKIRDIKVAKYITDITVERCLFLVYLIDYYMNISDKDNLLCCIDIIRGILLDRALDDAILEYLTFTLDESLFHLKVYIVNCKRIEIFDTEEIFSKIFEKYGINLRNKKHGFIKKLLEEMGINIKLALKMLYYDRPRK